jgi:hypothetical protein
VSGAPRPDRPPLADEGFRSAVWRAHGAAPESCPELLAYGASPLPTVLPPASRYPLPDAPCVAAWERYAREADAEGALPVLRRVMVQLRFPIRAGMSRDERYRAATRRGVLPEADTDPLALVQPDGLRLLLHPTPAGRVPVILAEAREDFEALVQAITCRNEPDPVPASMGACTVAGYNDWARVAELRRDYLARHPADWSGQGWDEAFRRIVPQKELYQDRFLILSSGPYSATPASALGLDEAAWRDASIRLRLEHECTHYFMRQAFGSMRKSLLDELVADYLGLVEALGEFRADHFLRFMGLEAFPAYREGGRLQNYRGAPPLSDAGFAVLPSVVKRAAQNLARLDPSRGTGPFGTVEKAVVITALTRVGLEGLASDQAPGLLAAALDEASAAAGRVSRASAPGSARG